jgi:1,4-alpha-glucan branching enzyme
MGELMRPIGDLDLHLFGEGTHRRLWELFGPQPLHVTNDGDVIGARFATWAPDAESVFVVGEWNEWTREPMSPVGVSGIWSTVVPSARTGQRYAFDVAAHGGGVVRLPDSMARETERAAGGLSMVAASGLHAWTDDEWMNERGSQPAVPERLHHVDLGFLQQCGTNSWEGVADDVLAVGAADLSHVELSPAGSSSAWASWASTPQLFPGLFAPNPSLGDPDGFRRFVNILHRHRVGVVVDWPPIASEDELQQLHHELHRNEFRNQLMANALYWLEEFHVDGLRIVAADPDAQPLLARAARETVSVVSEEFPDAVVIVD